MRAYKQYYHNLSLNIDEKELNKQLTPKNLFQKFIFSLQQLFNPILFTWKRKSPFMLLNPA